MSESLVVCPRCGHAQVVGGWEDAVRVWQVVERLPASEIDWGLFASRERADAMVERLASGGADLRVVEREVAGVS